MADLDQVRTAVADATADLPDAELAELRRYAPGRRRSQAEASRLLIRAVLGRALDEPPTSIQIVRDDLGRPRLSGQVEQAGHARQAGQTRQAGQAERVGRSLGFNVSHDGGLLALVLDRHTCGIDVEDAAEDDLREVADRFCGRDERPVQRGGTGSWARALWVAKESAAKAIGRGLRAGLRSIRFVGNPANCWAEVTWHGCQLPLRTRTVDLGVRHLAITSGSREEPAVRVRAWRPDTSRGRWRLVEADRAPPALAAVSTAIMKDLSKGQG